jgi:microcompartment protein PduB
MQDELIDAVLEEVMKRVAPATSGGTSAGESNETAHSAVAAEDLVQLTEFIGIGLGETQGIVIANLDPAVHDLMGIDPKFRSIGVIGGRVGAGPQIMAADDAVKATNTEIVSVEMPRDTKGGAGHGNLIVFGAEDVSDARRAVEVSLETLPKYFGDVYTTDQGHLELQYSARASRCLDFVFNAPQGKAFGLILGAPAVIGVLMIDSAVKAANVQVVGYGSPTKNTSFSNEVMIWVSGDAGAVRQAVISGREVGKQLLGAWGEEPKSVTQPYI